MRIIACLSVDIEDEREDQVRKFDTYTSLLRPASVAHKIRVTVFIDYQVQSDHVVFETETPSYDDDTPKRHSIVSCACHRCYIAGRSE
jgi:hypothetical protein